MYCPHCMQMVPDAKETDTCQSCGGNLNVQNLEFQLPVGTILAGRYYLGKVIGQGGFGITYVGCDTKLNMKIAVKEFSQFSYPSGIKEEKLGAPGVRRGRGSFCQANELCSIRPRCLLRRGFITAASRWFSYIRATCTSHQEFFTASTGKTGLFSLIIRTRRTRPLMSATDRRSAAVSLLPAPSNQLST